MYPRALNTQHDAEVDAGPLGVLAIAVRTPVIARGIHEVQAQGVAEGKEGEGRRGGRGGEGTILLNLRDWDDTPSYRNQKRHVQVTDGSAAMKIFF